MINVSPLQPEKTCRWNRNDVVGTWLPWPFCKPQMEQLDSCRSWRQYPGQIFRMFLFFGGGLLHIYVQRNAKLLVIVLGKPFHLIRFGVPIFHQSPHSISVAACLSASHETGLDQIGLASSNGICGPDSYSPPPERWLCCSCRGQWNGTMQHPTFGRRTGGIHSDLCRLCPYTALLRSGGTAVALGGNGDGQCNIPALEEGMTYTQISAGVHHTVLLRSDGISFTIGKYIYGHCNIPPLDEGLTYTQISAGMDYTVLLRSHGSAVAVGENEDSLFPTATALASHPWMRGWHKPTFLEAVFIQCFCGVMAVLLPSETMKMDNATFCPQSRDFATSAI